MRQESGEPFASVVAETTALDRSREVLLVWTQAPALPDSALAEDTGQEVWKAL